MSKHYPICKSKTLDVPIIITSSIEASDAGGSATDAGYSFGNGNKSNNGNNGFAREAQATDCVNGSDSVESRSSPYNSSSSNSSSGNNNSKYYKLDKALSLDSHYLKSQGSLSSSSTNNDLTSTPNSVSSSTSSFQFHNQQFLLPPQAVVLSNINADFEAGAAMAPKVNKGSNI